MASFYNGNISWMITDLSAIACAAAKALSGTRSAKADRTKGMQAMVYQYDQLHRITQSRSLTAYSESNGFATRATSPAAYDEDYSYDPNGNLLTLQRRDENGNMLNEFDYQYYPTTNKLRQVEPPADKVYDGGAIVSNTELYRKITIKGNAYVPQGKNVDLRALEEIEMDREFQAPDGTDLWAHIVADSGMYQYDAIGNLILDQYDGVKISWTPYGKVRDVKTKNDSVTVSFRYNGGGDRIEKRVAKFDTTYVTHYVRDASGNVMTIYSNTALVEQPIYGSSRVGMYRGGSHNGQESLGEKNYELSNHLGNILAVITDNIGVLLNDTAFAKVSSTDDYYPFGLEMTGRTWKDTTSYRYGFNGKEKDESGELGSTHYDYGFRIYNPSIGRFLSVDPLTNSYPSWSPYPFAMNSPIAGVDLDGLEFYYAANGSYLGRGTDEKNQDVYKADSKNADGTFNSATKLDVTHEQFTYISGVISKEDASTSKSAAATTQATFNAVKLVKGDNTSMSDQSKYASELLGTGYSSVPNKTALTVEDESTLATNARAGLIHVLLGGDDHSNGAIAWDGVDFAIKGSTHPKGKDGGFTISETLWSQFTGTYNWCANKEKGLIYPKGTYNPNPAELSFTNGTFEKEGAGKYTKGNVLYKASAVHGQHLFWAPNKDDSRNKGYIWKGLNSFLK